jgi:hypothetical protein
MEEAYREGVKQWNPDLYQDYPSLRADAEERLKQLQVAYRELKEHNTVAAEVPVVKVVVEARRPDLPPREVVPAISFGGALGCLTAKQFTSQIEEMVAPHLGRLGLAQAIVDLSGSRSRNPNFSQFMLLASRGIMVRDSRNMISVIWYTDLGEVKLIEPHQQSKPSGWQKFMGGLSGGAQGTVLQIDRSNGVSFYTISNQVDDSVKMVIYNFLLEQKAQAQP